MPKTQECKLRLVNGDETVIDISSQASFVETIRRLAAVWHAEGRAVDHVQMDIRYAGRWWSLSDNLADFVAWLRATSLVPEEDVERFEARPLAQPSLLFIAAEQMCRLLQASESP